MKKILFTVLALLPMLANAAYDVTGDGSINAGDVSALYEAILNPSLTEGTKIYDVNGDGSVNAGDVSELYAVMINGGTIIDLSTQEDSGDEYIFSSLYDVGFHWKIISGDPSKTYRLKVYLSGRENGNTLQYRLPTDRNYVYFTGVQMQSIVTQLLGYNELDADTRVELKIMDGNEAVSNTVSYGLSGFVKKLPKLWYLVGNSIGAKPWDVTAVAPSGGLVPMYPVSNTMQMYVGWFPQYAQFKLISTPSSWDEQLNYYNINYPNSEIVGLADESGDTNILIKKAGLYEIDVYTNDNTISIYPYMNTGEKLYDRINIVGDMTEWSPTNADYEMTAMNGITSDGSYYLKNTEHNHDWHYNISLYDNVEMKFAGDNNWAYNWGAKKFPYGIGVQDGANIVTKTGENSDYDVYFNDITGNYLFKNKNETPGIDVAVDFNALDKYYYITDKSGYTDPESPLSRGVTCVDGVLDFTESKIYYGEELLFKIVPQSAFRYGHNDIEWYSRGTMNVDADGVYSGTVVRGGSSNMDDAFYAKFETGVSEYKVHIDLNKMTYTLTPVKSSSSNLEYIYAIGSDSNWEVAYPLRSPGKDNIFKGYASLSGAFKFRSNEDDWDGTIWGDYSYVTGEGGIIEDGDDISSWHDGYYEVTVDMNEMRWSVGEQISSVGLIGPAVGGWDADHYTLTFNPYSGAWEGTVTFTAGDFKFRANEDWMINWGGTFDNLVKDGNNITAQAGTYKVRLYLHCEGKARCVLTKIN